MLEPRQNKWRNYADVIMDMWFLCLYPRRQAMRADANSARTAASFCPNRLIVFWWHPASGANRFSVRSSDSHLFDFSDFICQSHFVGWNFEWDRYQFLPPSLSVQSLNLHQTVRFVYERCIRAAANTIRCFPWKYSRFRSVSDWIDSAFHIVREICEWICEPGWQSLLLQLKVLCVTQLL